MKTPKKLISIILSLVLIFLSNVIAVYAESELFSSFNIKHYSTDMYGAIVSSQLRYDGDKIIRAEIAENIVHIEEFDKSYSLKKTYSINGELKNVCGVHIGDNYNFIICSQTNPKENDNVEVVRIIKYSKTWQRIASASIYGANTYIFADAGSLRFAEYGNYLYVRSCHEMYMTNDGKHHQANMTFVVNTKTMTVTYNNCQISNLGNGYVSHSFNQFIAVDEDTNSIIAVDHGDAYPRSIIMFRYNNQLGASKLVYPSSIDLFYIAGNSGDNITGVTVSDVIVTDNNYIVAFNSTPQDNISVTRNIYLAIVPKNSFNAESVSIIKLTDYTGKDNVVCGYPYITDIGNGKYSVIWEANKSTDEKNNVYYTTVDENGNLLTNVKSFEAYLSDCEPVLIGNKVIWYSTFNSEPVFYYVSNTGAGVACDKYESVKDKFQPAEWEFSEYFSDDSELTLTIDYDPNVSITNINATSDTYMIKYSSAYNCIFKISTYNNPGTYYLYATLSDGKIIKKGIVVKNADEKNTESTDTCTHSYRASIIQYESCTTGSITEYTCNYCGHSYKDTATATGHIDADMNCFCDKCNSIIVTKNPTAHIKWDKSSYDIFNDECATFTVECDENVSIAGIYSSENCYAYSYLNKTADYFFNQSGTITVYVLLSDGQMICSDIIVTENGVVPTDPTITTPETTTKPDTTTVLKGDMDNNGKVTPSDARSVLRIAANLDSAPDNILILADMDNNAKITPADARKVLRIAANLDTY